MRKRDSKGRYLPIHGGYSAVKPLKIRKETVILREGLVRDLGPVERDLTTAQIILINRVVSKLAIIRSMEEYIGKNDVMTGARLSPSLRESYLAYNNSIRLDLQALGINKRQEGAILAPYEIVEEEKKR